VRASPVLTRIAVALCLAALAGCSADAPRRADAEPPPRSLPPPDLSEYRLAVGDGVRIEVFGEENLTVNGLLDVTGHISYPLLGSIKALKKTAKELQEEIRRALASGYLRNPDVRVLITHYRPLYIIGQVRRPGVHPYSVGLTVEKALAVAGGVTRLASTRRIYLLPEGASVERRIRVGLDAYVRPGDTLVVEEGLF